MYRKGLLSYFVLIAVVVILTTSGTMAQVSIGGVPPSFQRSLKGDVPSIAMGYVDVESLLAEDSIEEEQGVPYRFGYSFSVNYTLENCGTWETFSDGSRLWRLKIEAPDAYSINLIYDDFRLPEGALFYLYNEDRSMVLGAFTSQNNKPWPEFATGLVRGDVCYLEYYEPANPEFNGIISISNIVHGYKNLFNYKSLDQALGFGDSGSCNNNVNCPEGADWQTDKRAVAMILTSGGSRICTGTMVNNVRQDLTPYFLTANHCLGGETTWVFMFNYESPGCTSENGPTWMTVSGSIKRANNSYSDFALLELVEAPPDSYSVFYAGWERADTAAQEATCIHHPNGDIKKISFEYDALSSAAYLGSAGSGVNHWRVADWDDGTTEPGSSGSPLFDASHHIVGQLHGGYAACGNDLSDWYGKFSKSWAYGSTSSTRLKDWLDPDNADVMSLDGIDGAGVTITHTPLEDTRDTLNDYEVIAEIKSVADLIADSTLLYYEINSIWTSVQMTYTGSDYLYSADIPAQSPGTSISYYLFAVDEDGYADTTETYSFYVIDYDLILEPSEDALTGAVDDMLWYDLTVTNNGLFADDISLTVLDNSWPTTIWDETMSSQISSTGSIDPEAEFNFKVRVIVPVSYYGDTDTAHIRATSGGNSSISVSSTLVTTSAGQPVEIPFLDNFPTTTLDAAKWVYNTGAEINTTGLNVPSAPYSLNFDGDALGADTLLSQAIDLSEESNIILRYYYEQTGDGESPDTDDDLVIQYIDQTATWHEISRHYGSGSDMTEFEEVEITLPSDAYHSAFRLRIFNKATVGDYDDWFIDDIYVGYPSEYDFAVSPSFQTLYGPAGDSAVYSIWIHNDGAMADGYDLIDSVSTWAVTFFDASGTTQISTTGSVPAGDSIEVIVKVEVPGSTPLHVTDTATIYVISAGDPNLADYTLVATKSAGYAVSIPWYETFPDDTLYTQRWFIYSGAEVSISGINEPSYPYSLQIDGDPDTATTQLVDLDGLTSVYVSYYYQAGGAGTAPDVGEDLEVEYRNSSGIWISLASYPGTDASMSDFQFVTMELPVDAFHNSFQLRFRAATAWTGGDWFIDNIRIDYAPDINVYPSILNSELVKGDSTRSELVIENNGDGELLYSLEVDYEFNPGTLFAKLLDLGRVEPASRDYPAEDYISFNDKLNDSPVLSSGTEVEYNAGGPDTYGYCWIDSDESGGPVYQWIDISSTGTDIISQMDDDNYVGPISLGFDFKFYGVLYDEIYIGSNGLVGFLPDDMDSRGNTPIPADTTPNAILAWLWDDLDPTDADNTDAHLYYQNLEDRFVITFQDYPEYKADAGDVVTAQIILYGNNTIKYQYQSIAAGFTVTEATVGIENHDGSDGLQVVYNSSYLHDNLAIHFYGQTDWLLPDKYSGTIDPGANDTIICRIISSEEQEPGTYLANITITNNDPDGSPQVVSAEMILYGEDWYTCGDANGDDFVNISDAVAIINYVFTSGAAPDPLEAADVNCDLVVNVSDAVYIINYIFISGPAPCADCP